MAELLVRDKDNSHSDPTKDLATYKRGDVVVVMPDGHQWGNREYYPQWIAEGNVGILWEEGFVVIKIPGRPVSDYDTLVEEDPDSEGDGSNKYRRRKADMNLSQVRAKQDKDGKELYDAEYYMISEHDDVAAASSLKPPPPGQAKKNG